jgi:hypothetical protein
VPNTFAIQLFAPGTSPASIAVEEELARLRAAFEIIPFAAVLMGCHVPEIVAEVRRLGAGAFLWTRTLEFSKDFDGVFLDFAGQAAIDRAGIEALAALAHEAGLEAGAGCTFSPELNDDLLLLDPHVDWIKIEVDSEDPQFLYAVTARAREAGIASMYAALDVCADNLRERYRALRAAVPNGFIVGPDLRGISLDQLRMAALLRS